jgi:hypothetical protein
MTEKQIEMYLVKQVAKHGGEVRKVSWIGRRGAPDRLVMLANRVVWVELKSPQGRTQDHQVREHNRLKAFGFDVRVINSIEAVDDLINE